LQHKGFDGQGTLLFQRPREPNPVRDTRPRCLARFRRESRASCVAMTDNP
jgi:hypothetical protein